MENCASDVLSIIFSFLSASDLCAISRTCRRFKTLADSDSFWENLCTRAGYRIPKKEGSWKEHYRRNFLEDPQKIAKTVGRYLLQEEFSVDEILVPDLERRVTGTIPAIQSISINLATKFPEKESYAVDPLRNPLKLLRKVKTVSSLPCCSFSANNGVGDLLMTVTPYCARMPIWNVQTGEIVHSLPLRKYEGKVRIF